ncbi:MAG: tetratricopeptide repeat protein [Firmicutes bacterium]|nr:tetratricopeptide repeat protein [Bacillota bacterium]
MKSIDQRRVIEKMDEYMSRRDYKGAERHLLYWLEEAKSIGDKRGELLVRGELIGHFRKTGDKERGLLQCDEALRLIDELAFDGTISSGTTYVNIATCCDAFGEEERALSMFEKARTVYEQTDRVPPELMGGLYNNLALTLVSLKRIPEAMIYFEKALSKMELVPAGALERAITLLNMADAWEADLGPEAAEKKIEALLDEAYDLLKENPGQEDGYYAFVLEKCAPVFEYYGCFLAAEALKEKAETIYQRNKKRNSYGRENGQ